MSKTEQGFAKRLRLSVLPCKRLTYPALIGDPGSGVYGITLDNHEQMEYQLPNQDKLVVILNYQSNQAQVVLFTHSPEIIKSLPGSRSNSLVADTAAKLNHYRIRSKLYGQSNADVQHRKFQMVNQCIKKLVELLPEERSLSPEDFDKQEHLRRRILRLIEALRDENRELASHPLISEGYLGKFLYDLKQEVQHFEFNQLHPVSLIDQQDYSQHPRFLDNPEKSCFVWDSKTELGNNNLALEEAFYELCKIYKLNKANSWGEKPSSRFRQFVAPLRSIWQKMKNKADELAYYNNHSNPVTRTLTEHHLLMTQSNNRIYFQGLGQVEYESLSEIAACYLNQMIPEYISLENEQDLDKFQKNDHILWAVNYKAAKIYIKQNQQIISIRYCQLENLKFLPLPSGEDLMNLMAMKSNPLSFRQRLQLNFQVKVTQIPVYFRKLGKDLLSYLKQSFYSDFKDYIHKGHDPISEKIPNPHPSNPAMENLEKLLKQKQLIDYNLSINEFIQQQLQANSLIPVHAHTHRHSLSYNNPFHRTLGVIRHFAGFFVDVSERNPMAGTLALFAYLYGGASVIAPNALTSVLIKLHLNGLIVALKPAQFIGQLMGHGTVAEAISASATLWQTIIVGGNIDIFVINAIEIVQDNPLELALVLALAMGLGYGLCQGIPSLQHEMGIIPLPNYLATGAKAGAALYDTLYNPGNDWFFGTGKWLLAGILTGVKILVGPFLEGLSYGFKEGFLPGLKKSIDLIKLTLKGILAASMDLLLSILTLFLMEIPALFIHVPFRGISNLVIKTMAALGHVHELGQASKELGQEAIHQKILFGFRLSPLYGFPSLSEHRLAGKLVLIGLYVLKNSVIALTDLFFGLARLVLQITSIVCGVGLLILGTLLEKPGTILDKLPGSLLNKTAGLTLRICNYIDRQAGRGKQWLLSQDHKLRSLLYHWAFTADQDAKEEELTSHSRDVILQLTYCTEVMDKLLEKEAKTSRLLNTPMPIIVESSYSAPSP